MGYAFANLVSTKQKTAVPLFFASTGGFRLPSFQTYTASKIFIILIFQSVLNTIVVNPSIETFL